MSEIRLRGPGPCPGVPHRWRPLRNALLLLLAVPLLLSLTAVGAQTEDDSESLEPPADRPIRRYGDLVQVFSGDIVIEADEERRGTVVCIGGDVTIHGEVTRDVIVIFGSLRTDGAEIGGQVVAVLSDLDLRDTRIEDQLVNVLGGLRRQDVWVGDQAINLGFPGNWFPGVWTLFSWLRALSLLTVFVMLVLLVALLPERVRLIAEEAPLRYVSAWFVGLLAYVGLWVLGLFAAATVLGLFALAVAYYVLKWLALAGLFLALGQRIGRGFGLELSPLGAVISIYAIYALVLLVLSPFGFFGWLLIGIVRILFLALFEIPAVGLVLLTRAGTRSSQPPVLPPARPMPPPPMPPGPAPATLEGPPAQS